MFRKLKKFFRSEDSAYKRLLKLVQEEQRVGKPVSLTLEELARVHDQVEGMGDGQAVFFGAGTEEEFKEFEKEQAGMSGWYERIKNLV